MTAVDRTVDPSSPVGPSEPTERDDLGELGERKRLAEQGPDPRATERQHAKGKLTARERIALLLDKGSFTEVEPLRRHRASGFGLEAKRPYTDGVVTGWGTVEGRTVFVYAHDFRIFGGALGEAHAQKIHKIMDLAVAAGAPLVSLNDGAGARIQEGVSALALLRRYLQPQHPGVRRHPADQCDAGTVCGRRRLLMRPSPISSSRSAGSHRCSSPAPMSCRP